MTAAARADKSAVHSLLSDASAASASIDALFAEAAASVRAIVSKDGKLSAGLIEREQHAAHGLAWLATYAESIREMTHYAERTLDEGRFGETEELLTRIGLGEYLAQVFGGIPMSQGEMVRPEDFGLSAARIATRRIEAVERLIATGNTRANRARLADLIDHAAASATVGDPGLDETMEAIRSEIRKFAESEVMPHAHEWHLKNEYIPLEVIKGLADLGVFGLTIPEEFGGMGLGKIAMCVVSEELSRAYIGVGSLGTRSEIAGELILGGGTPEQKAHWLPKIASGEILPTAVFTEPNTGSDLASLRTRATREGDVYVVNGNKTWITHPVRADLMTLLARTNVNEPGYKGLSILLAEKPRGDDANPFPAKGMSGGEIEVLGYRGMKEYEIAFDGFEVPAAQPARRRGGSGLQAAHADLRGGAHPDRRPRRRRRAMRDGAGLRYAKERIQFGKALINFPRVADKIAMMAVEVHDRPPDHLFRRPRQGRRPALRSRGRHGQAARRPRRLGGRRQRAAGAWRQRLRARISGLPRALRRPHPQHFRGRGGDSGAGHRPASARRRQLNGSRLVSWTATHRGSHDFLASARRRLRS
jgi:(2S)-methylsuccinyl-CoA dehydrogenase